MKFTRVEKDGKVGFTDGERSLIVPTREALRERLIKLLEDAKGDKESQIVTDFWRDRCRDVGVSDDLARAWGTETYTRLWEIWDDLTESKREEGSCVYE